MLKFYMYKDWRYWQGNYIIWRTSDNTRWLVPIERGGWAHKRRFDGLLTNCVELCVDPTAFLGIPPDDAPPPGLSPGIAAILQGTRNEQPD
jgi:hypothetical protein